MLTVSVDPATDLDRALHLARGSLTSAPITWASLSSRPWRRPIERSHVKSRKKVVIYAQNYPQVGAVDHFGPAMGPPRARVRSDGMPIFG